jgi:hypothetical protein
VPVGPRREPEDFIEGEEDPSPFGTPGDTAPRDTADASAQAFGGRTNEVHKTTFGSIDEPHRERSADAPRRQPRAGDDVHYTTSPFETPRSEHDRSATPVAPTEKRGLVSRAAGTVLLASGGVVGVAAVVLTLLMQVYISVPLFLVAFGLFYAGRGSLRDSAEQATEPGSSEDHGRRREPDIDD